MTYFLRRLSFTTHSTLSHLQFPHGKVSTTSQRTLRARQETHALAARRLVIFGGADTSADVELRFFEVPVDDVLGVDGVDDEHDLVEQQDRVSLAQLLLSDHVVL